MIHPTAIVHPQARLDPTVQVGPFAIIDEGVEVGPGCVIGPQVYLTGLTTIGAHNRFYAGRVIGSIGTITDVTDLRLRTEALREHVTVHRSNKAEEETVIGAQNFLMAHSHVAHNCHLGNFVVLANGALLVSVGANLYEVNTSTGARTTRFTAPAKRPT